MIKLFSKGLGAIDKDVTSSISVTKDEILNKGLDLSKGFIDTYEKTKNIRNRTYSKSSAEAPFETLFHDFDIKAEAFYNFWTHDELTNSTDVLGDRKLEDVPRFIKLQWNAAPEIKMQEEKKEQPKNVNFRGIEPVLFAREVERPQVFNSRGIVFSPQQFRKEYFDKVSGMLANGYLAPGVVEAVVELPLLNAGAVSKASLSKADYFDEDVFLSDVRFEGIAPHELKANIAQSTNGFGANSLVTGDVKQGLVDRKQQLVDGKFSVSLENGGELNVEGVQSSSPPTGMTVSTAKSSRASDNDIVQEMKNEVCQPEQEFYTSKKMAHLKVKFFNPAIDGLIKQEKVNLMSRPEHIENMLAVAQSLPDLEILSRTNLYDAPKRTFTIPSIPSPKMNNMEYIGYILQKYVRNPSGLFVLVKEISIPDRKVDSYVDTEILYGEVYRYRIKSIIRWTRDSSMDLYGADPTVIAKFGSTAKPLAPYVSSFFSSEWSHRWAYASCLDTMPPPPPDELSVRPESHRKRICISMKVPYNPQRDISSMRLLKRFKDSNGKDISGWMQVTSVESSEKIELKPKNILFFDEDVDFVQTCGLAVVYAAQCMSVHGEESTLSEQLCVRLNKDYKIRGEFPVEMVSSPGVRRDYFGAFSTIPHRITKTEIVLQPPPTRIGKSPGVAAFVVSGRDTVGNSMLTSNSYVCRAQSLDTGEVADVPFSVAFKNVQDKQTMADNESYVSGDTSSTKNSDNYHEGLHESLKKELSRYKDSSLVDDRDEDNEVFVYDRPSPHAR